VALSALASWRRTERAIRLGEPLPAPRALPVLVGGVVVVAALLAAEAVLTAR
jgi:putative membrane protein